MPNSQLYYGFFFINEAVMAGLCKSSTALVIMPTLS